MKKVPGMKDGKKALYHCNYCNKDISGKIRIKCVMCPDFDLCVECFSVGAEVHPHKSNHPYRVMVSHRTERITSLFLMCCAAQVRNLYFFGLRSSLLFAILWRLQKIVTVEIWDAIHVHYLILYSWFFQFLYFENQILTWWCNLLKRVAKGAQSFMALTTPNLT